MSNQQPSGSNSNNMPFGSQSIRFEDINDEYIAQLLSGYWPQPQNAPWGTSQNMDIPVPFSQTTTNASTSNYQPSHDTSTLPAPPAIVASQEYHQFTFDELMRQIDREREVALVPQPSDAVILSTQTTSLQRTPQAQREVPGSSSPLPGFQGHSTQTTGSNTSPSPIMPDIHTLTDNNLAAPTTQTSTTASRRGSVSAQEPPTGTGEFLMYPCDLCPASFARKRDCQRHRRGHTGELPYACEACGERFVRSDARGRHFKNNLNCEQEHHARLKGRPV